MRTIILLGLLTFMGNNAFSQALNTSVSYQYMYAPQWDNTIQYYNFSRPFLTEKQPLLVHGLKASGSYLFNASKKLSHGIHVSYAYFRSSATNEPLNVNLNLHLLNFGYILHLENLEKPHRFYTECNANATSSLLTRGVNGEAFVFDEALSKAFGIGIDFGLKYGYRFTNKIPLSPFISFGYTPYLFSPNTESVINQTKGLASSNWTRIFTAQAGLTYHLNAH